FALSREGAGVVPLPRHQQARREGRRRRRESLAVLLRERRRAAGGREGAGGSCLRLPVRRSEMNWLEPTAVAAGIISVYLSVKQKIWSWPTALVNVALY